MSTQDIEYHKSQTKSLLLLTWLSVLAAIVAGHLGLVPLTHADLPWLIALAAFFTGLLMGDRR